MQYRSVFVNLFIRPRTVWERRAYVKIKKNQNNDLYIQKETYCGGSCLYYSGSCHGPAAAAVCADLIPGSGIPQAAVI